VDLVATALAPGGRFVWLSPFPARLAARAARAGLRARCALDVDMGGFVAQLQRFDKPAVLRPRSRAD